MKTSAVDKSHVAVHHPPVLEQIDLIGRSFGYAKFSRQEVLRTNGRYEQWPVGTGKTVGYLVRRPVASPGDYR